MNLTTKTLRAFFGWCALCNYAVLLWWFAFFIFANEWLLRLFVGWGFEIAPAAFASLNYGGMMIYETGILLFNLIPFAVLWIIDRRARHADGG